MWFHRGGGKCERKKRLACVVVDFVFVLLFEGTHGQSGFLPGGGAFDVR
jgi:hypothetical protein